MSDFLPHKIEAAQRLLLGNSLRCHLRVLGDSALHFELSYFVQQPAVNSLLDLQHAVNLAIIDEFRRAGIEFDYPTQRVVLAQPRTAAAP